MKVEIDTLKGKHIIKNFKSDVNLKICMVDYNMYFYYNYDTDTAIWTPESAFLAKTKNSLQPCEEIKDWDRVVISVGSGWDPHEAIRFGNVYQFNYITMDPMYTRVGRTNLYTFILINDSLYSESILENGETKLRKCRTK